MRPPRSLASERLEVAPLRHPFASKELATGERYFEPEASPGGCASGACVEESGEEPRSEARPVTGTDLPPVAGSALATVSPLASVSISPPPLSDVSRDTGRNFLDAEIWRHAVELIRRTSPRHGMSLAHGRVIGWADGLLTLGFGAESAFHRSTVSGNGKAVIEKAFSEWVGRPVRLAVTETASTPASSAGTSSFAPMSLAQQEAAARVSREKAAENRLRTHPAVRAALQILGGQIEHVQVLEKETLPTREFSPPAEDGA